MHLLHLKITRFIPACAGNALRRSAESDPPAVHPRVCGERASTGMPLRSSAGSSPRVRGTLHFDVLTWPGYRFIPACAGNASAGRDRQGEQPVHPRVCGERLPSPRACY